MEILTTQYEWNHGKKPRGDGYWAVRIDGNKEIAWETGTITEIARKYRKLGAQTIEILP